MFTKHINSAATNNARVIKKPGARLFSLTAFNAGGAAAYVKLYNSGADGAVPVVGTATPVMVLAVPAAGSASIALYEGAEFPGGLSLGIVTGAADSDNTAAAANQVKATLVFGG